MRLSPDRTPSTFTAIDFETAQYARSSICQVGLVRVEAGVIVRELSLLVQPPDNYYRRDFIGIHGITPQATANSPTFAGVWPQMEPFIAGQRVVAHNGFRFDFEVLEATLELYRLPVPAFDKVCTLRIYRKSLAVLCVEHRIPLNHHDALSDARACAELYLRSQTTRQ
jgi:DNA polymerase-3 subunit epsilon